MQTPNFLKAWQLRLFDFSNPYSANQARRQKMIRLASVMIAAVMALSASAVHAQTWYGDINGSIGWLEDSDNVSPGSPTVTTSYDTGFGIAGHIGAIYGSWRFEGELGWQTADADQVSALGVSISADGDVSAVKFMANVFYDFNASGPWKPYIGAGIGYANISADISAAGIKLVDDDDGVFAYQFMGGIGYQLSPTTTIYGGYKYFATEDPAFTDTTGFAFESEVSSHNVEAGVRFKF